MGKRTLQTQLILAPTIAMIIGLSFGLVSSIVTNVEIRESHISKSLALSVENVSRGLDETFLITDSCVEDIQLIAENQFPTKQDLIDDANFEETLSLLSRIFGLAAKNSSYVCAYWLAVDPNIRGARPLDEPGEGFFYVRDKGAKNFYSHEVTNIAKFWEDPEANKGNIAWWTTVSQTKTAIWLDPYYNANVDQNMITYTMPFFTRDDEFLGAVGLDLQFDELTASIANAALEYPKGTAHPFLMREDGVMVWHPVYHSEFYDDQGRYTGGHRNWTDIQPNFSEGLHDGEQYSYHYQGVDKRAALRKLSNNMIYVLTVEQGVLNAPFIWLMWTPILVYLLATAVIIAFMVFIVRRSLRPLRELREAVNRVEQGDLSVHIKKRTNDEIGELTESFAKMVESLRSERAALNALAARDGLTGVKNQAAYREKVAQIDAAIIKGEARFATIMVDVDDLKTINDTKGHINGDKAIRCTCVALCRTFIHSPVYRVGGDEFVAIVDGEDYEKREELVAALRALSGTEATDLYTFSVGLATYQPGIDESFDSVFQRSDGIMYQEKRRKKEQ